MQKSVCSRIAPFCFRNLAKLYGSTVVYLKTSTVVYLKTGTDYDQVAVAWQFRWDAGF